MILRGHAHAEIENAEVADQRPHETDHAIALDAQQFDIRRHGHERDESRQHEAEEIDRYVLENAFVHRMPRVRLRLVIRHGFQRYMSTLPRASSSTNTRYSPLLRFAALMPLGTSTQPDARPTSGPGRITPTLAAVVLVPHVHGAHGFDAEDVLPFDREPDDRRDGFALRLPGA